MYVVLLLGITLKFYLTDLVKKRNPAFRHRIDHDVYKDNFLETWQRLSDCRKTTIAAVSGYAVRHTPTIALLV